MHTFNDNEDTTMTPDNFNPTIVTTDSLIRAKPAVTIHTFMVILTLMFIFALAFVWGMDYFLQASNFSHKASLYPCLFDSPKAFCVALKS